jgi:hypothetical protein
MKTGTGLAEFAKRKIGTPYFYGAKWNVLTETYMQQMHSRYPKTVTNSYMNKARKKGQLGKENTDCSGLIYGYRGKNIGSYQLYSTAKKRLPISDVSKFAVGTVLWKKGHVGVYVGDGKCVEAKGINYGVVMTEVSSQKWEYGLTFDDMEYSYAEKVAGTSKGINPYPQPAKTLYKGCKGDDVKWLQWELVEAGFDIKIDGSFGPKTEKAVAEFQTSCKLAVDKRVGPETRKALKAN